MGRPRTPIGTFGDITYVKITGARVRARPAPRGMGIGSHSRPVGRDRTRAAAAGDARTLMADHDSPT